jgi:uncharacterized membrane protein
MPRQAQSLKRATTKFVARTATTRTINHLFGSSLIGSIAKTIANHLIKSADQKISQS